MPNKTVQPIGYKINLWLTFVFFLSPLHRPVFYCINLIGLIFRIDNNT